MQHQVALEAQEQVLAVGVDGLDRAARPRRSGQRSAPKRGCGVAISSGTWPARTGRMRLAAWWIVSPSGMRRRLGAERELARALPEAELDEQRLVRRADHGLAVDALERQLAARGRRGTKAASASSDGAQARVVRRRRAARRPRPPRST